jgi:hypothetical protein
MFDLPFQLYYNKIPIRNNSVKISVPIDTRASSGNNSLPWLNVKTLFRLMANIGVLSKKSHCQMLSKRIIPKIPSAVKAPEISIR